MILGCCMWEMQQITGAGNRKGGAGGDYCKSNLKRAE